MQVENAAVLRLRIVAESDPSSLVRALQLFQTRNLIPHRVAAVRADADLIEIAIDVDASECSHDAFRLIVAKLNEIPLILEAAAEDRR